MAISLKVHLKLLESSPPAKKSGEKNCRVFLCDWMKQTNPFCKIEFVSETKKTSSEQKNSDLMEEKRNLMTGVMDGSQLRSPAIALIEKSFKAEKLINFSC